MRAAPHHARTRVSWKRAQGPGSRRPPRWGGGQHCGLCNLWMEKRFHARTSTSSSTFPSQRASVPPIQFLPHLWAPGRLFPSHPLLPLSGPPLLPPPKSRRCNRSRRTLRPPAGSPSLVPASLPASLPLSTTSAGQRRGILEYYGTAVPLFFLAPHLSGAAGVGALLHAPSVQRPASCRPAPSRLKHTQAPPSPAESRVLDPLSRPFVFVCVSQCSSVQAIQRHPPPLPKCQPYPDTFTYQCPLTHDPRPPPGSIPPRALRKVSLCSRCPPPP